MTIVHGADHMNRIGSECKSESKIKIIPNETRSKNRIKKNQAKIQNKNVYAHIRNGNRFISVSSHFSVCFDSCMCSVFIIYLFFPFYCSLHLYRLNLMNIFKLNKINKQSKRIETKHKIK